MTDGLQAAAYDDKPQPINFNVVISAPHLHAHVLELLGDVLQPGARVLDVGSGSGILCAAFYECVRTNQPGTCVIGIEHIDTLVELSKHNLNKSYSHALASGEIVCMCGDGRLGCAQAAPFDAIHVGAGTEEVPQELLNQLKVGGKIVIPVGPKDNQFIYCLQKQDN